MKIRELFKKNTEKVYFYLPTEECKKEFARMLGEEGFVNTEGESARKIDPDSIMSVHKDGVVYFCGQPGHYIMAQKRFCGRTVLRIDFEKFVSGEKNYACPGKRNANR